MATGLRGKGGEVVTGFFALRCVALHCFSFSFFGMLGMPQLDGHPKGAVVAGNRTICGADITL